MLRTRLLPEKLRKALYVQNYADIVCESKDIQDQNIINEALCKSCISIQYSISTSVEEEKLKDPQNSIKIIDYLVTVKKANINASCEFTPLGHILSYNPVPHYYYPKAMSQVNLIAQHLLELGASPDITIIINGIRLRDGVYPNYCTDPRLYVSIPISAMEGMERIGNTRGLELLQKKLKNPLESSSTFLSIKLCLEKFFPSVITTLILMYDIEAKTEDQKQYEIFKSLYNRYLSHDYELTFSSVVFNVKRLLLSPKQPPFDFFAQKHKINNMDDVRAYAKKQPNTEAAKLLLYNFFKLPKSISDADAPIDGLLTTIPNLLLLMGQQ